MDYQNYLLQLNSGNIAPLTLQQGGGYIDEKTNIEALLNLMENPCAAPRYRIYLLNDDDTIREEIPLGDLLASGNYSENYQNGQRCSLSLTLFNQSGKYMPTINNLWVGTKLRFDVGQEQQDGSIIWAQKGVFVITSTQPSYSAEVKTVAITAGDKFAELEGEVGTLSYTYEIPTGSRISAVVKELLGTERGNGVPIDSQPPYFYPSLINKLTQAKITKGAGDTIGSLILELANHLSAEVFYNAQGRLCFFPLDVVGADDDKPILFNYVTDKGELTDLNFSLDYSSIVNKIILVGATVNGGVVRGEAINNDPASPLCVQRIGSRVSVINESAIKTNLVAEENARYQLRKQLILKATVNLNVPFTPVLGVNNLILVTDSFYELIKQYFLIQSVSFSLDYSPTISITVANLANLPFIYNYKEVIQGEEDRESEIETRYPVTVNLTDGSYSGPDYIVKKGVHYIRLLPNPGYRLPYYDDEPLVITGATSTYDRTSGMVTLANPVDHVYITGQCYSSWKCTVTKEHCSFAEAVPTAIPVNGSMTLHITSDSNYYVPGEVKIVNASYTYEIDPMEDRRKAVLVVSNPTGPVSIEIICTPPCTVTVYGTVGANGIWPSSGIVIFDGKLPDTGEQIGTITYPNTSTTVTIKSSYMTVLSVDVDGMAYSNLSGAVYDSSVVIQNETYLIFRIVGEGTPPVASVDVEVMGTAAPVPAYVRVTGVLGASNQWPVGGVKVYKDNLIANANAPLVGTIETSGNHVDFETYGKYFSIEVIGPKSMLTEKVTEDATLRSQARYADGYIMVYEVMQYGGNYVSPVTDDPAEPQVQVTVAADQVSNHVDIQVFDWCDGAWPTNGIRIYDGDYSGVHTGTAVLRKTLKYAQSTVGVDITTGFVSLVADTYEWQGNDHALIRYPITLITDSQGTMGDIQEIATGIMNETPYESYVVYSVSETSSLYLKLYGIFTITLQATTTRQSFENIDVYPGEATSPIGTLADPGVPTTFYLRSYLDHQLTVMTANPVSLTLSLAYNGINPPGALPIKEVQKNSGIKDGKPYITFTNFYKYKPVCTISLLES